MGKLGRVALFAGFHVVLAGCGGRTSAKLPSRGEPSPPTGTLQSPLSRTDKPPAGVAEIYDGMLMGRGMFGGCPRGKIACQGGSCTKEVILEVQQIGNAGPGAPIMVCADGLGEKQRLVVTSPSGEQRSFDPPEDFADWQTLLPRGPAGTYKVAIEGSTTERSIEVEAAGEPVLNVLPYVKAGQPVLVTLAGFPPGQAVRLRLYRNHKDEGDGGVLHFATLFEVAVDATGTGELVIPTRTADPITDYVLAAGDGAAVGSFNLEAP